MKNFPDLFPNMEIRVPDNQSALSHLLGARHCREAWGGRRHWTGPSLRGGHSPYCKHRPSGIVTTRLGGGKARSPKPCDLELLLNAEL